MNDRNQSLSFRKKLLKLISAMKNWEVVDMEIEEAISGEKKLLVKLEDIEPITINELRLVLNKANELLRGGFLNELSLYNIASNYYLCMTEKMEEELFLWESLDIQYLDSPFYDEVKWVAKYIQTTKDLRSDRKVTIPGCIESYDKRILLSGNIDRALDYLERRSCITDRESMLGILNDESAADFTEFKFYITSDLKDLIKEFSKSRNRDGISISAINTTTSSEEFTLGWGTPDIHLVINNFFQIAKLSYECAPRSVWDYLLDNPNQFISRDDILNYYCERMGNDQYHKFRKSMRQSLKKIVEQNGFVGPLFRMFFETKGKLLKLRNPVSKSDLQSLNISMIPIR